MKPAVHYDLESHFIDRSAEVRKIYAALIATSKQFGPVEEDAKKTSIHLNRKTAFAGVQTRRNYLLLTVKSDSPIDSERVFKSEQTSAHRWHAEIKLSDPAEVDGEVADWLEKAYKISA